MKYIKDNQLLNPTVINNIPIENETILSRIDNKDIIQMIPFLSDSILFKIRNIEKFSNDEEVLTAWRTERSLRDTFYTSIRKCQLNCKSSMLERTDIYINEIIDTLYHIYLNFETIEKPNLVMDKVYTELTNQEYNSDHDCFVLLRLLNEIAKKFDKNNKNCDIEPMVTYLNYLSKTKIIWFNHVKLAHSMLSLGSVGSGEDSKYDVVDSLKSAYETIIERGKMTSLTESCCHSDKEEKDELEELLIDELVDVIMQEEIGDCDEEAILEFAHKINNLIKIGDRLDNLEYLSEANTRTARTIIKGAKKAERMVRKGTHKARDIHSDTNEVKKAVKSVPSSLINYFNSTTKKLKEMDKEERRNYIIERNTHKTIMRNLRVMLTTGSVAVLGGPWYGLVALLISVAIDARTDEKVKKEILREMEMELKIINEKLEDAKSEGAKEEKYKLMRLKEKLEKDIDRIKYNIK